MSILDTLDNGIISNDRVYLMNKKWLISNEQDWIKICNKIYYYTRKFDRVELTDDARLCLTGYNFILIYLLCYNIINVAQYV